MKLIKGDGATEPTAPPKVYHGGPKTLSRYIKICRRYGHPINMDTLSKLTAGPDTDGHCKCPSCLKNYEFHIDPVL